MSYVAHQYSQVGFYSSVEVNLLWWCGGQLCDTSLSHYGSQNNRVHIDTNGFSAYDTIPKGQ